MAASIGDDGRDADGDRLVIRLRGGGATGSAGSCTTGRCADRSRSIGLPNAVAQARHTSHRAPLAFISIAVYIRTGSRGL